MAASSLKQGTRTATRWPPCDCGSWPRPTIVSGLIVSAWDINSPLSKPLALAYLRFAPLAAPPYRFYGRASFRPEHAILALIVPFESRSPANIDRLIDL